MSLIDMGRYAAGQSARVAWYLGHRLAARRIGRTVPPPPTRPPHLKRRPAPSRAELVADLARLFAADASHVRAGLYSIPGDRDGPIPRRIARLAAFLADVRPAGARRAGGPSTPIAELAGASGLPAYYLTDFHHQDGGYLTAASARLYDTQVETLFLGAANAMRRQALAALVRHFQANDQRGATLLDIGCGTAKFLAMAGEALPRLNLIGADLSCPYLAEARRVLGRRRAGLLQAPGEALPLPDGSIEAASAIFLFHELPREVRRMVAREVARVLKPGGVFIALDSLQAGDRPGWDSLLDGFERSFNEPYYRDYLEDDLAACLGKAGLAPTAAWTAFLAKVVVVTKP